MQGKGEVLWHANSESREGVIVLARSLVREKSENQRGRDAKIRQGPRKVKSAKKMGSKKHRGTSGHGRYIGPRACLGGCLLGGTAPSVTREREVLGPGYLATS